MKNAPPSGAEEEAAMEKKKARRVRRAACIAAAVVLAAGIFLLAQMRTRYTGEVAVAAEDTAIDISADTGLRLQLNMRYHLRCMLFKAENAFGSPPQVVFVGDSITELADLEQMYPAFTSANRGIAGDTTRGILCRMEESVYGVGAQVVVLLAGINDLDGERRTPANTAESYGRIVREIRAHCPQARLVLQSVYPTADPAMTARVRELNGYIRSIAAEYGCTYIDVFSSLAAEGGLLPAAWSEDGLHPNGTGYAVVSKAVAPVIERELAECRTG